MCGVLERRLYSFPHLLHDPPLVPLPLLSPKPLSAMNTTLTAKQVNSVQNDQFLIGYHMVFLGILCTLSVILILFSTRYQRRIYLLALQVFALVIVIVTELMLTVNTYKQSSNVLHQRPSDDPQVLALQPCEWP